MTIKKYIALSVSALLLAGCSGDGTGIVTPQESLPLVLQPTLSGSRIVTRAVGGDFETDDELLCYVRHVIDDNGDYNNVHAKLVTVINGQPTEPLYWDDFSNSATAATDLRTAGHGLHTFYGYCYNGGTPSTALIQGTGVLGWTTSADQRSASTLKANDLLWSPSQTMVTYNHARNAHGTLTVPYSHAMSKFTIVLVAGDGFVASDLTSATVTLSGMNLTGTFTATTGDVAASGTTTVKMYAGASSTTAQSLPCRSYEAVSVPKVALTSGNLLADAINVGGNDYRILLTDDIISAWSSGIATGKSMSGVNYKLTVVLNKQDITLIATLADWTDVSASGTGLINFSADVKTIDKNNAAAITTGNSFSLWMTKNLNSMGAIATTAQFNGTKFVNTPAIYWPNGSDNYYFRALAQKTALKALDAVATNAVSQGTDLLWGTTSAHVGTEENGTTTHNYAAGAAINPRTGDVPLTFSHVMSNVVINLETSADASAVDLTGAKVTLTNLYNDGTVNIANGTVTVGSTKAAKPVDEVTSFDNLIMVPQELADNARLIVELADGTTYSLKLNDCVDGSSDPVAEWESGQRYTYTISVKKEEIKFRALIYDWVANTGSGNATLDWD